jgi:glutamate-1-semialdehyde 2,1-aminomutase
MREEGLEALAATFAAKFGKSSEASTTLLDGLSDLRFTDTNRVPFPFQKVVRDKLNVSTLVDATEGARIRDLDGNWSLDVSGSVKRPLSSPTLNMGHPRELVD